MKILFMLSVLLNVYLLFPSHVDEELNRLSSRESLDASQASLAPNPIATHAKDRIPTTEKSKQ